MNPTDLFVCTVTQVIQPIALSRFLDRINADNWRDASSLLAAGPHEDVLTPRYRINPHRAGVVGVADGGTPTEMPWHTVARLLAAVATSDRVAEFGHAYDAVHPFPGTDADSPRLNAVRHELAHAAATAGGLIAPPVRVDRAAGTDIQLRSSAHRTSVFVNRLEVALLQPIDDTTAVEVPAHIDPDTGEHSAGFSATVRFVPPGDSNAPNPQHAGRRTGLERLDLDNHDRARWAVQIDGFDTLIIDVSHREVHVSVYDQDPDASFLRFAKALPIPPPMNSTSHRLTQLNCQRTGRSL